MLRLGREVCSRIGNQDDGTGGKGRALSRRRLWTPLLAVLVLASAAAIGASGLIQPAAAASSSPVGVDIELTPDEAGYWVLDSYGRVTPMGAAPYHGGAPTLASGETAVSLDPTPSGDGYWIYTSLGRVHAYGDAVHHGDLAGFPINGTIVGTAVTSNGGGYRMLGSEGGIFTFGNATYEGSIQGIINDLGLNVPAELWLNEPIVGIATTPTGNGYWLVAADGGMFTFGDAAYYGSVPGVLPGGVSLNDPIVGMVPQGAGYLLVAADGGVFNFGVSQFHGSVPGLQAAVALPSGGQIAAVAVTADRSGYTMLGANGALWPFGTPANTLSAIGTVDFTTPTNPGATRNCGDFATQTQAQRWFDTYRPFYGDPARLDTNNNRIACETGLPAPPSAPLSISVEELVNELRITWLPPASSGSGPVLDYLLEWRRGTTGAFQSTIITDTSAAHRELSPDQVFHYRVSARNAELTGPPTAIVSGIPLETPADVTAPLLMWSFPDKRELVTLWGTDTVTVTLRVSDVSGLRPSNPILSLSSDSSPQSVGFGPATLTSGSARDGIYSWSATVSQANTNGTWSVILFPLTDVAGNQGTSQVLATITVNSLFESGIFGRPFLSSFGGEWHLPNIENAPGFTAIQARVSGSGDTWAYVPFRTETGSFGTSAFVADLLRVNLDFRHIREYWDGAAWAISHIWNRSPASGY